MSDQLDATRHTACMTEQHELTLPDSRQGNAMTDLDVALPGVRSRPQIEEALNEAEPLFTNPDPYQRQAGYDAAAQCYADLVAYAPDPTWKMACRQAEQRYRTLAARVRWEHRIPTLQPNSEVALLGINSCADCGRPWQLDTAGACEHCPQLLHGPTPLTAADAANYPTPTPVR
ncbi:MAG: hypothetical protein ACRDRH_21410 [Pseudonocardia sp.]